MLNVTKMCVVSCSSVFLFSCFACWTPKKARTKKTSTRRCKIHDSNVKGMNTCRKTIDGNGRISFVHATYFVRRSVHILRDSISRDTRQQYKLKLDKQSNPRTLKLESVKGPVHTSKSNAPHRVPAGMVITSA